MMAPTETNGPTEPIRATISSEYRWRVGLFAGFMLFWTGWCFLDGFVKYPAQRRHAEAFLEAKDKGILDTDEWRQQAADNGWNPDKDPGRPKSDFDIYTQFFMAAITTPLALIWGVGFIRAGGRWIALENDSLVTSWGQRVPLDAVTAINKQRWKSKGIAVVRYEENAGEKTLMLDDWKYTRAPIIEMVRAVEAGLSDEQILNGSREDPIHAPEGLDVEDDKPQTSDPADV